jgi:hypothetical protein
MLNPGIDASTSRIVAGLGLTLFDVSLNSLSTKGKGRIDKLKLKARDKPCPQAGKYTYCVGLCTHVSTHMATNFLQLWSHKKLQPCKNFFLRLESKKLILQVLGGIGR